MAPKPLLSLARMFGFGYPKRALVLVDKDDRIARVEDFTVTKKLDFADLAKNAASAANAPAPANAVAPENAAANGNAPAGAGGVSLITDRRTGEVYAVQGDVDSLFAPRRLAEVYREAGISAVLPGFLIYNVLLFWSLEALPPIDPVFMAVLGTSLAAMSIFNARQAYAGSVSALTALEKADVGGVRVFVPAMREYLALQPSENKQLRDSVVSALVSKVRPLEAANEKLMEELHQVADKVDTAFKLGLRLRNTFLPTLERIPAPGLLIGIFVVGLVLGWVLSGGVALPGAQPPVNSTIVNGSVVP